MIVFSEKNLSKCIAKSKRIDDYFRRYIALITLKDIKQNR
jgi:hypothetical protein